MFQKIIHIHFTINYNYNSAIYSLPFKYCLTYITPIIQQIISTSLNQPMADIKHGIAGGMAGITVDLVFYPLETIKTRIMASSPQQNLTKIAKSRFKGFSCQMIVSFPYSFTFFYTYESIRAMFPQNKYKNVVASICAQIAGNIVRNPFEVVKQQLMVGRNEDMARSSMEILKNKGFRGFYIGYMPTLVRDIVFSAIQLPLFQIIREKKVISKNDVVNSALSGSIAALIAGFVSCPLDVIKTRLMTQDMKSNSVASILKIYQESGIKGYFKGVGFRCGILSFGGVVYFGALQKARGFLNLE